MRIAGALQWSLQELCNAHCRGVPLFASKDVSPADLSPGTPDENVSLGNLRCYTVYPNNSSIGFPLGSTGTGRPLFRYSVFVSTPRC
jgi:hypothetical protein